jgi:hypothetical protein
MKLAIFVALGIVATSPALAAGGNASRWHDRDCRNISVGDQACGVSRRADRYAVYSYDGRLIGRDPDANVRMKLRDEDAYFRGR